MIPFAKRRRPRRRSPQGSPYTAWAKALRSLEKDFRKRKLPEIADLESYVDKIPEHQRLEALQDLVGAHLRLSWAAGKGRKLPAYFSQIEALRTLGPAPIDMIEDEFLARHQLPHGDVPSVARYEKFYPGRSDVVERLSARSLDSGRYLKLHQIGVGSVAVVWEGFDRGACRTVAIKELVEHLRGNPIVQRASAHEAEITSRLDHPGIVSLVEVTRGEGETLSSFYVMRMAGRETLADRIQDCHQRRARRRKSSAKQPCWNDLLKALARVCDAIHYAHTQGVLHCDIKPENVVSDRHGNIGVIDWGTAIEFDEHQGLRRKVQDRRLVGTPEYMAPEQINGLADIRSDVYCLGGILYETLTGRPPRQWKGKGIYERPADWAQRVQSGTFLAPRKIDRRISKSLEAICLRAMAVQPDQRQQSAAELAAELRAALAEENSEVPWVWKI